MTPLPLDFDLVASVDREFPAVLDGFVPTAPPTRSRPRQTSSAWDVQIWDGARQGTARTTNVFRAIRRQFARDYLATHGVQPTGRQWEQWRTAQRRQARTDTAMELGRILPAPARP